MTGVAVRYFRRKIRRSNSKPSRLAHTKLPHKTARNTQNALTAQKQRKSAQNSVFVRFCAVSAFLCGGARTAQVGILPPKFRPPNTINFAARLRVLQVAVCSKNTTSKGC